MRRLRLFLAANAALGAFALPTTAHAAQSYVVSLKPPPETSCERTILDVAVMYALSPTTYHTNVGCGFSAPMSKSEVRSVSSDPRVVSVTLDTPFLVTAAG